MDFLTVNPQIWLHIRKPAEKYPLYRNFSVFSLLSMAENILICVKSITRYSRIPWTDPEKKEGLRRAFEIWKPLCEEYHCSFATLVESWALSQYDRMSLLVGMRKASSVEDTVKCLDIRLRAEDIKCMEEAVKTIQVAVLDK